MKIVEIGLGYVGTVSAACMADLGHEVIAMDIDGRKVSRLNEGRPSIIEKGLEELLARHVASKRLRATTETLPAVAEADLVMIAVGTPSLPSGEPDLRPLSSVCRKVREAMHQRTKSRPLVVSIRSTVPPGAITGMVATHLTRDGHKSGIDFLLCSNPEFLREGSAIKDFMNPPMIVVGGEQEQVFEIMEEVYRPLGMDVIRTNIETAELIKYASNAFHALKVCFANEIGTLASELGLDGRVVMNIFCNDHHLNISEKYLKPGFSYGGSCLPKDVRAVNALARELHADLPTLASIPRSNDAHAQRGLEVIHQFGRRKVGLFGLAFKSGTSDLRSSPILYLMQRLQAKKYDVLVHDDEVSIALQDGLYEPYLARQISAYVAPYSEVVKHAEIAVLGKSAEVYTNLVHDLNPETVLIDLVGQEQESPSSIEYHSICWDHPKPQGDRIARQAAAIIDQASRDDLTSKAVSA